MRILKRLVLSLSFLIAPRLQLSNVALAQDVAAAARANRAAKASSTKTEGAWYSPTRVTLHAQNQDNAAVMVYEISSNQDLRITMDAKVEGKREIGTIMLVNGQRQWMLAKNVPMEKGYEIDALDMPVLNLKLVLELLRAAAPSGPSQIKEKTTFDVKEETRSIAVSTASANGGLEAPWSLKATIEPTGVDQVSFELTAKHKDIMHVTGTWQRDVNPPTLSDDLALEGWKILSVGPMRTTDGNETILDYGAEASKQHPKTLGELRKITLN